MGIEAWIAPVATRNLDALTEAVMITDLDQRIVYINAAFARLTGYDATKCLGRTPRVLQGRDTDDGTRAQVAEAVRRGGTIRVEILNYRSDGTPFWNDLSISPLQDAAGRTVAFISVQRDVTAERTALDRIRWSQRLYRACVTAAAELPTAEAVSEPWERALQVWVQEAGAAGALLMAGEPSAPTLVVRAGSTVDQADRCPAWGDAARVAATTVWTRATSAPEQWDPTPGSVGSAWAVVRSMGPFVWRLFVTWLSPLPTTSDLVNPVERFVSELAWHWTDSQEQRRRLRAIQHRRAYQASLRGLLEAATIEDIGESLGTAFAQDAEIEEIAVVRCRADGSATWVWPPGRTSAESEVGWALKVGEAFRNDPQSRLWTLAEWPASEEYLVLIARAQRPFSDEPELATAIDDAAQAAHLAWRQIAHLRQVEQLERFQDAAIRTQQDILSCHDADDVLSTLAAGMARSGSRLGVAVVRMAQPGESIVVQPTVHTSLPGTTPEALTRLLADPASEWHQLILQASKQAVPQRLPAAFKAGLSFDPSPVTRLLGTAWPIRATRGGLSAVLVLVSDVDRYFLPSFQHVTAQLVEHVHLALERVERQQELVRWASTDPLTGLANRRAWEDFIDGAWKRMREEGRVIALAVVDLDDFKAVNDQWGHGVGDEVLRLVAERLRHAVRQDDLVARLGGDEFVVCAELRHRRQWSTIAKRLRAVARIPIPAPGGGEIGVSWGVAFAPDHGLRPSDVLRRADAALYRVKKRRHADPVAAESVPLNNGVDHDRV